MSDVIVAPKVRDLDQVSLMLEGWLRSRLPAARSISVVNAAYPRGAGQSHETILFDLETETADGPGRQGCVIRIKPQEFTIYPDDLFEQQYRVMQAVRGTVKVAEILWVEEDPSLFGSPFFVMEKLDGRVPVSIPRYRHTGWVADATPQQRRKMWASGVEQLAAVQKVPLEDVAFLAGPPGARQGNDQELDKYSRYIDWIEQDRPWPVLHEGMARLLSMRPAQEVAGLVWGDSRLGNILFDDDFEAVAVMDWEQPSLGGALHDLAWWNVISQTMHGATRDEPHLEGMGTREETIALWEQLSGKSAADIEWYEDFAHLKMSCSGIRMAALRGSSPPDEAWLATRLKVA